MRCGVVLVGVPLWRGRGEVRGWGDGCPGRQGLGGGGFQKSPSFEDGEMDLQYSEREHGHESALLGRGEGEAGEDPEGQQGDDDVGGNVDAGVGVQNGEGVGTVAVRDGFVPRKCQWVADNESAD